MRSQKRQQRLGVYAGSFDPLTVGHLWMIEQGVLLFDRLIAEVSSSMVRGLIGPVGWQKIVRKYVPGPVYKQLLKSRS